MATCPYCEKNITLSATDGERRFTVRKETKGLLKKKPCISVPIVNAFWVLRFISVDFLRTDRKNEEGNAPPHRNGREVTFSSGCQDFCV